MTDCTEGNRKALLRFGELVAILINTTIDQIDCKPTVLGYLKGILLSNSFGDLKRLYKESNKLSVLNENHIDEIGEDILEKEVDLIHHAIEVEKLTIRENNKLSIVKSDKSQK